MANILALDQSSRVTGWSIFINGELKDWGHFTADMPDMGDRLVQIRSFMIDQFINWDIDTVVFEDIQMQSTVGNNVQTFKALANVFGVVYETAVEFNKKYLIVPSVTWKSRLGIKGKRRPEQKKNAQQYIIDHYQIKPTQDEADSICIGICALQEDKTEKGFDWSE